MTLDLFSGRSIEAKKALYRAIVGSLGKFGIPSNQILILLREAARENWGIRGSQIASEIDLGYQINV